jgi:hypothetical protein
MLASLLINQSSFQVIPYLLLICECENCISIATKFPFLYSRKYHHKVLHNITIGVRLTSFYLANDRKQIMKLVERGT